MDMRCSTKIVHRCTISARSGTCTDCSVFVEGEGGIGDFRVACVKGCLVECVRVWCARSYCFVRGVY